MSILFKKKIIAIAISVSCAASLVAPGIARGATAAELQAQIDALMAQLTQLQAQLNAAQPSGNPAACSGITFDRNLKQGMSGNDVKCLQALLNQSTDTQVAASGVGSTGNETTYFGALTLGAVVKFQEKYASEILTPVGLTAGTGYVGTSTRAKLNSILGGVTPTPTPTPTPTATPTPTPGSISVTLDSSSPAASVLVLNQGLAHIASFNFNGSGTITAITLKRVGVSADTTLANVYLFDGTTRLTDAASVSGGSLITFTGLSLAVSGSKTIVVKSTLAGAAGETVGVQLTAVTLSSGTVSGLPVSGALHSIASATLASVAVGTPVPSSASTTDPENDVRVWESTFVVGTRDVTFTRLALRQINSIPSADIQNFRLLVDGVQTAQTESLDANRYVTFSFTKTLATGNRNVKVLADVIGGSSYIIQMSLRNAADIELTDSQYSATVAATGTPASTSTLTVNSGSMVVEKASDSPTGNVTNGATGVTLAKYTLSAYGEPIKVETLIVDFAHVTSLDATEVSTLRSGQIFVNGAQVGSNTTLNPLGDVNVTDDGTSFATNFTVNPGSPATVEIRADIFDNDGTNACSNGDKITATLSLGSSNAERTVSLGTINVPSENKAANQVTVAQGTITLAKDATYADQTTVVPQTAYKIADYNLTGNSTEDVNLYTITVSVAVEDGSTFTYADLSNVYVKYGTTTSTIKSSLASGDNSWTINYTLAKNVSIPVEVYASTGSTITAGDSIIATTTITGTTVLSAQAANSSATAGQEIDTAAGSFTATADATTPVAKIVADNQTVDAAAFKLAAVNDKYSLTQVVLSVANATAVKNVMLKDGTTVLATLPGATTLTFNLPTSGTGSLAVNANANKVLTVSLELGAVGVGAGTTGSSLLVTLTSGKAITASTGVEAAITESNPTGSAMYVYAGIPTITNASLPTSLLTSGTATLAKFSVSSGGTGTVGWDKIIFTVNKTGGAGKAAVGATKLYDADSGVEIAGTATVTGCAATDTTGTIAFVATTEQEVSGAKTYALKSSITGTPVVYDVISTNIEQPVNTYAAPATYTTVAATGASFVWTDQSASGHLTTTADWNNEYLVKNLPTDTQTLTK